MGPIMALVIFSRLFPEPELISPVIIFSYQYADKSRSENLNPIYLSDFEYEETCIEQTDKSQVLRHMSK